MNSSPPNKTPLSHWMHRVIAHHEAGHVTVAWFLKYAGSVRRVVAEKNLDDEGHPTAYTDIASTPAINDYEHLMARLAILLAGELGIRMTLGNTKLPPGGNDDVAAAQALAIEMVCDHGMSPKLKHKKYPNYCPFTRGTYPLDEERIIEEEARRFLMEAKGMATVILMANQDAWDELAEELVRKERLTHDEIAKILGVRPPDALY